MTQMQSKKVAPAQESEQKLTLAQRLSKRLAAMPPIVVQDSEPQSNETTESETVPEMEPERTTNSTGTSFVDETGTSSMPMSIWEKLRPSEDEQAVAVGGSMPPPNGPTEPAYKEGAKEPIIKDPINKSGRKEPPKPPRDKPDGIIIPKFARKGMLYSGILAALLTAYAEKQTEQEPTDHAPKAVLNVGTLGVTLVKADIEHGNPETDFNARTVFAETTKEAVNDVQKVLGITDEEADVFFKPNPRAESKRLAQEKTLKKAKENQR